MYQTNNNVGFVRINYSTDIDMAAIVNSAAMAAEVPVISTPVTMGGYSYPILEDIADGRHFQILKANVPDLDGAIPSHFGDLIHDPETVYAYPDGSVLTVVQIAGWDRKLENLGKHGLTVLNEQKTPKRLKTVNRAFRLFSRPTRSLRIALIDDSDYSDSDMIYEWDDDIKERLLDGGFILHQDLYDDCLANINFPVMNDEILTADDMRAHEFYNQARKNRTFNARIFGEFDFVGGLSIDRPCALKGQAFLDVSDHCDRMKVDIIAATSAMKFAVTTKRNYVLLEPQSKKARANGDNQSICHNPALYKPEDVKSFVRKFMYTKLDELKNDKLMAEWYNMALPVFTADNQRKYDQDDLITLTKWNARSWVMSGMRLVDSPWLFEQMSKNILSLINTKDDRKMRIPIPCAVRCQVVSQSLSSAAGVDLDIEPGQIRWSAEHEVLVVHDEDWIEMYESHGGMDLDDFFVAYWRTINNRKVVVIMRSPNDFGEYSIFDYCDEDWYPQEEFSNGETMSFPVVTDNERMWPKRLSEAVRDGEISYIGLPSTRADKDVREGSYTASDVIAALSNNVGAQSCIGLNVNARSLWSITMRKHRAVQLCPMESCIDTGAQGGAAIDIQAVTEEANMILSLVVNDPDQPKIDRYTWMTRFEMYHGIPFEESRLVDGHLTEIHDFRRQFADNFMDEVTDYVSRHVGQNADPRIHDLGARLYGQGYDIMLASRRNLAANQRISEAPAKATDWESLHITALSRIYGMKRLSDRHDLVMAIYSASLQNPTSSTGKISDQLLMNPALFDHLMNALRFYGIAGNLSVSENGKIERIYTNSWELNCVNCGASAETDNALLVQRYYADNELCPACSAPPALIEQS